MYIIQQNSFDFSIHLLIGMLASATSCADTAGGPELMVGLAKSVFSSMIRDLGRDFVLLDFFYLIGGGPPSCSSCGGKAYICF